MNTYDPEELKSLLRQHSLKFGNFTLASGQTASYYLDCRRITLHPRGAVGVVVTSPTDAAHA